MKPVSLRLPIRRTTLCGTATLLAASLALPVVLIAGPAGAVTAPKVGQTCKKSGQKSGTLVCTKKAGKLVWARPSTPTTTAVAKGSSTQSGSAASTVAASGSAASARVGVEGTWKPTSASIVGYRVKEILEGQSTEGVGRTNAVSGTMVIAGTSVTSMEIVADLTKLQSDSNRRDDQVQDRILETAKFPKATMKLKSPFDFGSVPADRVEISKTITASLTLHGVTKDVKFDVKARLDGANLQVTGSIPIVFADYNIADPSFPPFVKTEDNGLLEFALVFA
jgi:polyisoprenoid-binding protein YceI